MPTPSAHPHLHSHPEQVLITQLQQGLPQAVQQWFTQYSPKLLSFVKQKVSAPADAEELVQETFINALKQLTFFRGHASLLTWMQAIARHEIADYYRKKYAKKAIRALPLNELLAHAKISDSHETAEQVKETFKRLNTSQQELLLLKYIDNKKVAEIAHELGTSVKAIESDLFRARQAFKLAYANLDFKLK